ncbi:MAG: helix-turn-helix transcriptional regulator [Cytophagaceae bacterium]|nr:helix-turn-helix transcriptional regulator [Cytophagaceae bacterium]
MKLYIKNMISLRCKMLVKEQLKQLGIPYIIVELGTVDLLKALSPHQSLILKEKLLLYGLELMDNSKKILIEKIKNIIIKMTQYGDDNPKINHSNYISEQLNYDYTYLSNIFSEANGITIQQSIINHKIERVKELILYNELNLTEISYKLRYSSVAHLSSQFKKVTGLSPSCYKKDNHTRTLNLEDV